MLAIGERQTADVVDAVAVIGRQVVQDLEHRETPGMVDGIGTRGRAGAEVFEVSAIARLVDIEDRRRPPGSAWCDAHRGRPWFRVRVETVLVQEVDQPIQLGTRRPRHVRRR
ncbi:hypothetical protein GCM10023200_54340 [Actinomycetospora chlora]|uniref:Uncharacterized protein n=1 Tax=Actinomycetospora chlora TaxID=663608 RepID=A0ABP9CG18_9PSEU